MNAQKRCLIIWTICVCLLTSFGCSIAKAEASDPLRIYGKAAAGEMENPVLQSAFPQLAWELADYGREDFMSLPQLLITKADIDLYALGYAYDDFRGIVQKGYAAELSSSAALMERVEGMYPFIKAGLRAEAGLYGIPISLSCSHWAYSQEALEAIGLAQPPQTYGELLDILQWWAKEGWREHPEIRLLRGADSLKGALAEKLLTDFIDYWAFNGSLSDTYWQELATLLDRLMAIDTEALEACYTYQEEGDAYRALALVDLSVDWMSLEGTEENAGFLPLPLRFMKDQAQCVAVDMRVFIISANSTRFNDGVLYITTYLESIAPLFDILTRPGEKAPLPNIYAAEPLEAIKAQINAAESRLAAAAPYEKREIIEELETYGKTLQRLENAQWLVSREAIAHYEQALPAFYLREHNPLLTIETGGSSFLADQVRQLLCGKTTGEQVLAKLKHVWESSLNEAAYPQRRNGL